MFIVMLLSCTMRLMLTQLPLPDFPNLPGLPGFPGFQTLFCVDFFSTMALTSGCCCSAPPLLLTAVRAIAVAMSVCLLSRRWRLWHALESVLDVCGVVILHSHC
jgi:hypothetical protein